jgi:hypothetical protein
MYMTVPHLIFDLEMKMARDTHHVTLTLNTSSTSTRFYPQQQFFVIDHKLSWWMEK